MIVLICWKESDAVKHLGELKEAGLDVVWVLPKTMEFIKRMSAEKPQAILIDLDRLPSQGRDMGLQLRMRAGTRTIPLVFAGSNAERLEAVRRHLPDAVFTEWENAPQALRDAIRHPLVDPYVPDSAFAPYAGKPLAHKLGIKAGMRVGLLDAPEDFPAKLGKLPEDVRLLDDFSDAADLLIWFVSSQEALNARIGKLADRLGKIHLWIAWPKRISGVKSDLTQQDVRDAGLVHGLVDYKICSIDETWSGLLFKKRNH
jgi:hypothetical protein